MRRRAILYPEGSEEGPRRRRPAGTKPAANAATTARSTLRSYPSSEITIVHERTLFKCGLQYSTHRRQRNASRPLSLGSEQLKKTRPESSGGHHSLRSAAARRGSWLGFLRQSPTIAALTRGTFGHPPQRLSCRAIKA